MKYCTRCGNLLNADARFCPACGFQAEQQPVSTFAKEQEMLNFMDRMLKFERLSWKIAGHVFLWVGVALSFLGLLLTATDSPALAVMGLVYALVFAFVYIPIGIINLKAAQNAQQYREQLFSDVQPARERCGSVGMIVFSAFFNTIAMIFIIINFAHIKSNPTMLDRIAMHQQEARTGR